MVGGITRWLGEPDHLAIDAAVHQAIKKGWLIGEGEPPHRVGS
jgi:hypothetical protein